MRSAEEARAYFTELRATLESLDVSDVRMEEGSLRADANISTRRVGETAFGTKVEIKNLNSVRSLERALRYEEERQRKALDAGESLVQETRHFDEEKGTTHTLRSKEEAFDYRYFPEPDLPPLEPTRPGPRTRDHAPELPAARRGATSRSGSRPTRPGSSSGSAVLGRPLRGGGGLGADAPSAAKWITQDVPAC
jgi:aspartyl-tRNA(Asn)/glutamyl-tRNA(Gln) amidotransferase subunit B